VLLLVNLFVTPFVAFIVFTTKVMSTRQLDRRISLRHREQPRGLPNIDATTGLLVRPREPPPNTANVTPPAYALSRSSTQTSNASNTSGRRAPNTETMQSTEALLTQNGAGAIRPTANQNQANVQAPFRRPPNVIAAPSGVLHEHEDLESLTTATTCVREHLFPNQKFLILKTDLDFSNRPGSVCRRMAAKCHVPDHEVEVWWNTAKKTVHTTLKLHRNNVIKSIKTTFVGKFNSVLSSLVGWLFISLKCLDHLCSCVAGQLGATPDPQDAAPLTCTELLGMRGASTAKRYAKFLYLYAKSVTGLKKWNANCKTSPLSEYFTLTDEAFLLLCHESYTAKWLSVFHHGSLPDATLAPIDANDEIVLVSNIVSMVTTCV
jgi:hypothetical protein